MAEGTGAGAAGGATSGTRPADVMGVPALPPARLTGALERLRAAVLRLHRRMAPPPVQVLEGLFGALDHAALCALCKLDVPDRLDGPTTADELAERVHADPGTVRRVVAYAGARGWVDVDRRGRVRPNRTTRFLRRDHPGGWRAWVDFAAGPEVTGAVARLADDPRTPDTFAAANGAGFFDWYLAHPARHAAFDAAMAAGGRLHGLALSGAIDWPAGSRVCDVGGGTGALLRVLVERHPGVRGVLFDLPAVVARAPHHERIDAVGGDAFAALPPGCDTYLFVNVLHDWDDDAAVRMLRHVASTGGGGARAVVVEGERRTRPRDGITTRTDLLMLALAPGGRERTTDELAGLAGRAGLTLRRSVRLVSGDRAHVMS